MDAPGIDSRGLGFLGTLTLIIAALKMLGVVGWSWGWVLLPLYGPFALVLIIAACAQLDDWISAPFQRR